MDEKDEKDKEDYLLNYIYNDNSIINLKIFIKNNLYIFIYYNIINKIKKYLIIYI